MARLIAICNQNVFIETKECQSTYNSFTTI